jgi:hypothetical protein
MTTPTIGSGTRAWTPGPWNVEEFQNGGLAVGPARSDGSLANVIVFDGNIAHYNDEARARYGADFRLIAAAPELYRELDELVEWLHNNQRCVEGMFSMDDLLEGPRAALAKAEGRNP